MDIEQLSLTHWRNFADVKNVAFPQGHLLVAVAPNATGKTNFLEALVMLLRGKSWRAAPAECVQWGADHFVVAGNIRTQAGTAELKVVYEAAKKKMSIQEDGSPTSVVRLYGKYPVVFFLPEDTFLFTRGPEGRRNFLNGVLVALPAYLAGLVQYHRGLKQRNAALKSARSFSDVAAWTDIVAAQAEGLYKHRQMLVDFLGTHVPPLYQEMSGERRDFSIRLKVDALPETLFERLEASFPDEQRYGHTLWGPHRDDIIVRSGGRDVAAALSQGQMRSLVIALKVASHRFLEQVGSEKPLVLFDEVLSELDRYRQQALLEHLPNTQMVMTCTALPRVLKDRGDVSFLDIRTLVPEEKVPGKIVHAPAAR